MNKKTKVGVIGLGGFGKWAAGVLSQDKNLTLLAYDKTGIAVPLGVGRATLAEAARADVLVLAVPLSAYRTLLPKLRLCLPAETLVIDICSIKLEAECLVRQLLPGHHNLLFTHPLFGPVVDSPRDHALVVTGSEGKRAEKVVAYCRDRLGIKIERVSAAEHDQAMAQVAGLTFFVARGLTEAGVKDSRFTTPMFRHLVKLAEVDQSHSEELFRTMELGNPFAGPARQHFLDILAKLHNRLNKERL